MLRPPPVGVGPFPAGRFANPDTEPELDAAQDAWMEAMWGWCDRHGMPDAKLSVWLAVQEGIGDAPFTG